MSASPNARAGVAVAAVVAIGLLVAKQKAPKPDTDKRHTAVEWDDGGAPLGTGCVWLTARASLAAQDVFGLDAGGTSYVHGYWCAPPSDGGEPPLPSGMDVLLDTEWEAPYDAGPFQAEFWLQGHTAAGFKCACSTGSACLVGGSAAPLHVTLQPGWSGAGCLPKPCGEWLGSTSWPAACP